jgi:short-subunit dehydrogenase
MRQMQPYGRRETVVITGATAGVGRATARVFATAGANVGLIARDEAALKDVASELEAEGGGKIRYAAADVSDPQALFVATDMFENELGPIDIWINDAMLTVFSPVTEMTAEEFHAVTETTYLGYVHGTMAALRVMRPRNHGKIVQVGSSLAYRGIPLQSAYCGAKHAIRGFTDALRTELIHDKSAIGLTMVQLPAVNTPQFDWARDHMPYAPRPVPPVVEPEVAAAAIYAAARGRRREYWLGLSTLKVILANMLFPGRLDHLLAKRAYDQQMRKEIMAAGGDGNLEAPITSLHRTQGSFGGEARSRALLLSDLEVRVGLAALGLSALAASIKLMRRNGR